MPPTYADLYREHHARIEGLCRLLLASAADAEEIGQEVFLRLHRSLPRAEAPMAWGAWLTRVAVNACRDRRRARWWRAWRDRSDELVEAEIAAPAPTPEETVASREQHALVWAAFRRLPTRQREVFALRQIEGWSTEDTARALGVSTGSVKRHLSRAVSKLRAMLGGLR